MSTKKVPYSPNKEASDPGEGGSSRPSRTPHSAAARANVREELSNNEFIVERIMGYRQINKVRYARVKWAGYPWVVRFRAVSIWITIQSNNQSMHWSISPPMESNQSINRSIEWSISLLKCATQSINRPITWSTNQSINPSIAEVYPLCISSSGWTMKHAIFQWDNLGAGKSDLPLPAIP